MAHQCNWSAAHSSSSFSLILYQWRLVLIVSSSLFGFYIFYKEGYYIHLYLDLETLYKKTFIQSMEGGVNSLHSNFYG